MNHKDWCAELTRLTQLDLTDIQAIRQAWAKFIAKTESTMRESVNDWHVQQTLGLYALELRRRSEFRSAIELDERIGDDAEKQITYWSAAAGNALAQAATDRFKYDESDELAIALTQRALNHLERADDNKPIGILRDKLTAELRKRSKL